MKILKNQYWWRVAFIIITSSFLTITAKKYCTCGTFVAGDNDLKGYALKNLKEMMAVGSNDWFNCVVQLNTRIAGNKKTTRRYYVAKDTVFHVNANDPFSQAMDSGDPNTLISFLTWMINNYPAEHYILILWNHGTGIIDPIKGRIIDVDDLYVFNPTTNRLELDRSIGFFDFISQITQQERGICWDDSSGHYLSNQDLAYALRTVSQNLLNGSKLSIIGFDACLMGMLEIANIVKPFAQFMIASQEVELGPGWNYQGALAPFARGPISMPAFSQHLIDIYHDRYHKITEDYTLSAINLEYVGQLEHQVDLIAQILLEALQKQSANSVKKVIRMSRNKQTCTHFDEPSYVDLAHFLINIKGNTRLMTFANEQHDAHLRTALDSCIDQSLQLIKEIIIANTTGKNLLKAHGISIYFPEHVIHPSYKKTTFAQSNAWHSFLIHYLA